MDKKGPLPSPPLPNTITSFDVFLLLFYQTENAEWTPEANKNLICIWKDIFAIYWSF